ELVVILHDDEILAFGELEQLKAARHGHRGRRRRMMTWSDEDGVELLRQSFRGKSLVIDVYRRHPGPAQLQGGVDVGVAGIFANDVHTGPEKQLSDQP